eukprot:11212097-Ditylum_brightwellii.AAC.1
MMTTATKKNDFTCMTTHSISAGKEQYNSIEVDQRTLWPRCPPLILASCGDSSSHACSASHEA